MSKHFLFLAGFLAILTFLSNISEINSVKIEEITDSNINSVLGEGTGKDTWLLMFYLDTCPYCKMAKEAFSQLAIRDEIQSDETLKDIKIGQIECSSNNWSCLRFNITRVPTVVQLKHDKLFEYNKFATVDSLLGFIAEEKLINNGKPIPEQMGVLSITTRILREAVHVLNEQISDFVNDTLKLNIEWTPLYTVILLVFLLVVIILIEFILIQKCMAGQKVPVKKVLNQKVESKEQKKDEEKEEKKDEEKEEKKEEEKKEDEDKEEMREEQMKEETKEENKKEAKIDKEKQE